MKIFPILHFLDRATTLWQVSVARRCGAAGVFLLCSESDDANDIVDVAWKTKQLNPSFAVGIKLPSFTPLQAAERALEAGLDMVWTDDMGVSSTGFTAAGMRMAEFATQHPGLALFASVALAHQPVDPAPGLAAQNALTAGFVPTTTTAATVEAYPNLAQLKAMSKATRGTLAVASGITADNVAACAPYVSHILVSSGIFSDQYHIDQYKLEQLLRCARRALPLPAQTKNASGSSQRLMAVSC